jgi:hypothetical protein
MDYFASLATSSKSGTIYELQVTIKETRNIPLGTILSFFENIRKTYRNATCEVVTMNEQWVFVISLNSWTGVNFL